MALQLNIAEAKAKLSELVARAEAGEEVVLARAGKTVVKLQLLSKPAPPPKPQPRLGAYKHLGPVEDPDIFFKYTIDFEVAEDGAGAEYEPD